MNITSETLKKWEPILESADAPEIKDNYRRNVMAQLLENYELEEGRANAGAALTMGGLSEASEPATQTTANVANYDPVLIGLMRRTMPNLMAYDVCGVQPMTGPTGLIFAMRPRYATTKGNVTAGDEAFYGEAETDYSGEGTHAGTNPATLNDATPGPYSTGSGVSTADAEALGTVGGGEFSEMDFEIERLTVTAETRALKASYTTETAQDLRAIHGLDAEVELSNILASQILADINRDVVRNIYTIAKAGAQESDLANAGQFDLALDSNGRWAVEDFKGLLFQVERDANRIARETRRGKGNFIVCSSDVASAFAAAGQMDYNPAMSTGLQVDDTGNTFVGVLNGKYRVYIDPYATGDFYVVGYKGSSSFDAGLFYCPYVPLQMFKAVGEESFQPRIGFKTRYGLIANPFSEGTTKGAGALNPNSNVYYRRVAVKNLHGARS